MGSRRGGWAARWNLGAGPQLYRRGHLQRTTGMCPVGGIPATLQRITDLRRCLCLRLLPHKPCTPRYALFPCAMRSSPTILVSCSLVPSFALLEALRKNNQYSLRNYFVPTPRSVGVGGPCFYYSNHGKTKLGSSSLYFLFVFLNQRLHAYLHMCVACMSEPGFKVTWILNVPSLGSTQQCGGRGGVPCICELLCSSGRDGAAVT